MTVSSGFQAVFRQYSYVFKLSSGKSGTIKAAFWEYSCSVEAGFRRSSPSTRVVFVKYSGCIQNSDSGIQAVAGSVKAVFSQYSSNIQAELRMFRQFIRH
jgi:hypothetical protein